MDVEMIRVNGKWVPLAEFERQERARGCLAGILDDLIQVARGDGWVCRTVEEMRARDQQAKVEVAEMWAEVWKSAR